MIKYFRGKSQLFLTILLKYFCGEKNKIFLLKLPDGLPLLGLTLGDTGTEAAATTAAATAAATATASSASACFSA